MKNRAYFSIVALAVVAFGSLILCCNISDPTSPEKTDISAVFEDAEGKIFEGFLVDSVGKEIGIGAALYLPANFQAISFKVVEDGTIVLDSTIQKFNAEYFRDTVWIRHTFFSPGVKNVTITPFANPGRSSLISAITIMGSAQNTAPKWSVDTLNRTVKVGNQLSQALPEICTDVQGDVISYALIAGALEIDTILGSTYRFNPSAQNTGTHFVQIKASDPAGNSSILFMKITVETDTEDPSVEYKVEYNGNGNNGGTVPVDSNKYTKSSLVIVKDNTGLLTKTGATFAGWSTTADGSGTVYGVGATFSMGSSNVILYTRWMQPSPFTVTYDGNSHLTGAAPVDTGKYETGMTVTVKGNTGNMLKVGHTFTGWNTASDGSGTMYVPGGTFPMGSENVTLYARWTTSPTFTITFNSNGGTGTMADQSIVSGMSVPLSANTFTKSGAVFAGWTTSSTGTTVDYTDKAPYTMGAGNVTLYALWSQNPLYKITFNSNGGTGTMADQSIVSGMAVPLVANSFTKAGATFAGWVTTATGTTGEFTDEASYTMGTRDVVLYALWTRIRHIK